MSSELDDLVERVNPADTILLFGAGASIPSGAPSGAELARDLSRELAGGKVEGDDLMEACTLLENRIGRAALVGAVRDRLGRLKPDGGLLTVPEHPWHAIYSTNFDRLVETAYTRAGRDLEVVRSNFDFGKVGAPGRVTLYKIHGCISQDESDGHKGRMVLTEVDYEEYEKYREMLYSRLADDLLSKDVLVVGQSLRDAHLRDLVKRTLKVKEQRGAPGKVHALVYQGDQARADLLRDRGVRVAAGSLDEFLFKLTSQSPNPSAPTPSDDPDHLRLKPLMRVAAIDVDQARERSADPERLFNGRAASYADIASGLTFQRSALQPFAEKLEAQTRFVTITGVAGVGKTTFARHLLLTMRERGFYCWEHAATYPLAADDWLDVDAQLAASDRSGVLLIDDCAAELRQVNRLADRLSGGLRLVLTCPIGQWRPRLKSQQLMKLGEELVLSRLDRDELGRLIALLDEQPAISALVDTDFAHLRRADQLRRLRERAQADMYVCLKNVFASEGLDQILLTEFAALDPDQQDIYRVVAGLQAIGTRVHRQLVLRFLNTRADQVADLLRGLEGIVDEYEVNPRDGIYEWTTRHAVIALTLAGYKYGEQAALWELLDQLVSSLNPSVPLEMRTINDLCNSDFGIKTLRDPQKQLELYTRLAEAAPGERVPRHRMIRSLLDADLLDAAGREIRRAEHDVGRDRPLARLRIRMLLKQASSTPGILPEDRRAFVSRAEGVALDAVQRYRNDKFAYISLAEVGVAYVEHGGGPEILNDAIARMESATEEILDPVLDEALSRFRRVRNRLVATPTRSEAGGESGHEPAEV